MSTNDKIEDAVTRHQVFIMRYSQGRERLADDYVEKLIEAVTERLGADIATVSPAKLDQIIAEVAEEIKIQSEEYEKSVVDEMLEFIGYESEFNVNLLESAATAVAVTAPALAILQAAMLLRRMPLEPDRSYTINEALQEYSGRKSRQIVQTIRDGVTLGQTSQEINSNIKNLTKLQQRQAATLARTVTNYASVQAREVVMRENPNITNSYRWIATLDGRTSLICASRDQQIFKESNESPKPPAHFNCRSTIAPILEGDSPDQFRAALGDSGAQQVSKSTRYETWLRRQSRAFQTEVLGVTRAKLFREGRISIGRFVDAQGATLTLDQLRKLEPMVFEDLGI
jgi:SPP1 gp7 family putative phage head morphogenesis protein